MSRVNLTRVRPESEPEPDPDGLVHLSELFGPTLQGEGPHTGQPAVFVRLGGCNLTCRTCDTPHTWDGKRYNLRQEITARPARDVLTDALTVARSVGNGPGRLRLVVITGGEPLLHQRSPGLRYLVNGLISAGLWTQFETNGTLPPAGWLVANERVTFVVSPKIGGPLASDSERSRVVPQALAVWAGMARAGRADVKVVVSDPRQVITAEAFAYRYGVPLDRMWVMPEGQTAEDVLAVGQAIADSVARAGLRLSTRLHLLLWPNETRGR